MVERRLIDADALYDKVEQKYKVSSGRMHSGYREFLDMICDAPTVDAVEVVRCKDCKWFDPIKQEWISATERSPEDIGLYLVIEKHWLDGSRGIKIAKWNTVDWFTADRKSNEITPRVTHWMPLPKPPKGE